MVVYGTRPEAIKVAPLITAMSTHPGLEPIVAVTGQHREMLDQVNELFGITPAHDLDLMVAGATLTDLAARTLTATSRLIQEVAPDAIVVQGDTSTAFISALSAFYNRVPIIHLEAGLRSGSISSPFPEEANRRLTAPLAALHLAPTSTSRANLLAEGVDDAAIATTGNTVIDALYSAVATPASFADQDLAEIVAGGGRFVLVTAHRRESWGAPMRAAMSGLRQVARDEPEVQFVVPMHRNPLVREVVDGVLGNEPNVHLTEPLGYHEFCHAMKAATLLLTDSGGVQEEAPSLGKPVLVMRENTERPEAVDAGTVRLIGTDQDVVRESVTTLLRDSDAYDAMARAVNPYGDGKAAERSLAAIAHLFGMGHRLANFSPKD